MASLELYRTFKEEKYQFYRLLQKIEEQEIFPHLFYKANITLIPKPEKYILRNYRQICLVKIDLKILNKRLANQIQQYKNIITQWSLAQEGKISLIFENHYITKEKPYEHLNRLRKNFLLTPASIPYKNSQKLETSSTR